jgi:type II secretion system protein G
MRTRGFTLIELLVVIAIIGLLASIIMVSLSGAKSKSRDSKRQADLKSIQLALSLYYNDNGMYPKNIYAGAGTAPANGLAPTYLPSVPIDPNSPSGTTCSAGTGASCYHYIPYSTGSTNCSGTTLTNTPVTYHLGATMETPSDSYQDVDADNAGTYVYTGYSACTLNNGGEATFNGNAASCTGTTAAVPDGCFDVAP